MTDRKRLRFAGGALLAVLMAGAPCASAAPPPSTLKSAPRLPSRWEGKTREIFKTIVEIPSVAGRDHGARLVDYLAGELKAGGWADGDINVLPYQSSPTVGAVALIARWRAAGKPKAKPMLLLAHSDVVEALPSDWGTDPFKLVEKDGYFYGRGTNDNKRGVVGIVVALLKLRASGFQPNRDIILFVTGDEETMGRGAELGTTEWRKLTDAEFALNADAGDGSFTSAGKPLGFAFQTSEKTYQSYTLRVRNPGGHSSRPRPDNAIYELADALKKVQAHRFEPVLNETTRAYFAERAKQEGASPLGAAMRAWLADETDGAAADAIEANELEIGMTRTRCVATMLKAGHADNALPQSAEATVNCRIMPGVEPRLVQEELRQFLGPKVEVEVAVFEGKMSPVSPLRPDVLGAYARAVHGRFPGVSIIPQMSPGATDGMMFRSAGIPVYGVNGGWGVSPDDDRAHGKDERIPVQSLWDNVFHWERLLRDLAN